MAARRAVAMSTFMDLLNDLRERAQKGELEEIAVSPEGWAELEEIAGKREVGFPGKRMRSRSAVAHD